MNIVEVSYKLNGELTNRKDTKYIVIHHAAATKASVDDIDRWHKKRGFTCIGYHFYIRKTGIIYRGRPEDAIGAHVTGYNSQAIGVCLEGNFMEEEPNEKQLKALVELLNYLKKNYPKAKIVGHKELDKTSCPGDRFPLEKIKGMIKWESYLSNF